MVHGDQPVGTEAKWVKGDEHERGQLGILRKSVGTVIVSLIMAVSHGQLELKLTAGWI